MRVRIHASATSATQSGRARWGRWLLETEPGGPRRPESLMGWTSSGDTDAQVCLWFDDAETATAFARARGWEYELRAPTPRRVRPRSFADNFRPGFAR